MLKKKAAGENISANVYSRPTLKYSDEPLIKIEPDTQNQ
jgi:hypothetical protein